MLSQETIEQYRRMTGIERRFELLKRENDARSRNMLTAIARTREQP